MEKFLRIGLRHVQWVALGAGLLWLGLMAYFYLAQSPVTVELDGQALGPGEVDTHVEKGPLKKISDAIASKDPVPIYGSIEDPVVRVGHLVAGDLPKHYVPEAGTVGPSTREAGPRPSDVASLPHPPALEVAAADPAVGLSMVSLPQADPPAGAPATGGAAAAGGAGPTAAAPAQPVLAPEDHDWGTLPWVAKMDEFVKSFDKAHVPNPSNRYRVLFLRVQLYRQELSSSGVPVGGVSLIPPLSASAQDLMPVPDDKASNDDKYAYLTWAAANQQLILLPPFPAVTAGTPHYEPGEPRPADAFAAPAPGVAPLPVAPPVVPGLQPENGRGRGRALPPGAVPPSGIVRPSGGLPSRFAPPTLRPTPSYQPPLQGLPGQPLRPAPSGPVALPPPRSGEAGIPAGAEGGEIPGGFDPSQTPDITLFTHDWTVQAGKTYRYKVRYMIANPLYLSQLATKDIVETWAVNGPDSDWSKPVSIPSRYRFFAQQFQRNPQPSVKFDVFTKKPDAPGGVVREQVTLTPGDAIGGSGANLVDIRPDPKNRAAQSFYFLVSDASGRVERRDLEADKTNPEHTELNDRSGGGAAAAAGPGLRP